MSIDVEALTAGEIEALHNPEAWYEAFIAVSGDEARTPEGRRTIYGRWRAALSGYARLVPAGDEGRRGWTQHTDDCSRSREGVHSKGCTCGAEDEGRLREWAVTVAADWHAYWQGKDHRYGRDPETFLGERLLTDFNLRYEWSAALAATPEP